MWYHSRDINQGHPALKRGSSTTYSCTNPTSHSEKSFVALLPWFTSSVRLSCSTALCNEALETWPWSNYIFQAAWLLFLYKVFYCILFIISLAKHIFSVVCLLLAFFVWSIRYMFDKMFNIIMWFIPNT